jgi:hypothetical protein
MNQRFEYKFERLGESFFCVNRDVRETYQESIARAAREGWRLVQIFAPGIGVYGKAKYYELVFERPV